MARGCGAARIRGAGDHGRAARKSLTLLSLPSSRHPGGRKGASSRGSTGNPDTDPSPEFPRRRLPVTSSTLEHTFAL